MDAKNAIALLEKSMHGLWGSLPLTWRYAPGAARRPFSARMDRSWQKWEPGKAVPWAPCETGPWKAGKEHWFHADIAFPREWFGVPLAGQSALCFIRGWMPFTLWIDGKQAWSEERAWQATGPIADPWPLPIAPGQRHRLTLCVRPTDLPGGVFSFNVRLTPRPGYTLAVELDAAAAQLRIAGALARTESERRLVDRAAARIDARALATRRWDAVLESIGKMEDALSPLSARAKERVVHVLGHAHIDMDWMWRWADTALCIRRDFKAVADLMDEDPEICFTHSQAATYEFVRRTDPDVFARVKRHMAQGRWENAAATWVEGDLNMSDGESLARQMLFASDWMHENLGSRSKVLWEPDTFGHPGNMPQIARLGELSAYFHMRCNPRREAWPAWTWRGVDGSTVAAASQIYNGELTPYCLSRRTLPHLRQGRRNLLFMWGIGDHGGALSRLERETLDRWRYRPLMPTIRFSTAARYLAAAGEEPGGLPEHSGETYTLFEGCFTTQAKTKRLNRRSESALLTAEAFCALAGLDRNAALRDAWLPALFNQFHDILCGSQSGLAYRDATRRGARAPATAEKISRQAASVLVKPSADGSALAVLNPLGFSWTGPVRARLPRGTTCLLDEDGRSVPIQRLDREWLFIAQDVPAFSRKMFRLCARPCPGDKANPVRVDADKRYFTIDTRAAECKVDRSSGIIGSWRDKASGREFVPCGAPSPMGDASTTRLDLAMNVFQVIDESPHGMTAWLIHDVRREESLLRGAEVALVDTGPVFTRLRVRHKFRSSRIDEDVIIYRDFARVDFEARIDWREKGDKEYGVPQLKVSFASSMSAARLRTEGPFTVREVPADGLERPTQKWADISGRELGFALLNDSKYGVDALGGRMRLTLLRNTYFPDPESDNGPHAVRFSFLPHVQEMSNGNLVRAGMSFNRPPLVIRTDAPVRQAKPYLEIQGAESAVCTSLRRAEHSDALLVRLFETSGKPCKAVLRLGRRVSSATEVNFLENETGGKAKVSGGAIKAAFRGFEIKTLKIKYAPQAEE
jgi:alpha-mannosidase